MNFVNKSIQQSRELFLSLTPQARLMAVLMVIGIVVSAGFLVRGSSTPAMEYVFGSHVFKVQELKAAEMALSNAALKDYQIVGNRLMVPKSQKDVYVKALGTGNAFPTSLGSETEKALNSGNFLEPVQTSNARLLEGKLKDLGNRISRIQGIESAWVTYDSQREGFAGTVRRTATVFVEPANGMPLSDSTKRNIAKMVTKAFAGLEYRDVLVMDGSNSSILSGADDPMTSDQSKFYHAKRLFEEDLRRKSLHLLAEYGDVLLEVSAELDDTMREATEKLEYNEKPTAIQRQETQKSMTSSRPSTGGRPGYDPNTGLNQAASLSKSADTTSNTKESTETERRIVGHGTTLVEKVGLTLKDASISVSLPRSYYRNAWVAQQLQKDPTKKAEDITMSDTELAALQSTTSTKIQNLLAPLLPSRPPGADPLPRITVIDHIDFPPPEISPPSLASNALAWLGDSWQSLGLMVVAIFAILALRSAVLSQPKPRDEEFARGFGMQMDGALATNDLSGMLQDTEDGDGESSQESAEAEEAAKRFQLTGEKVREELSQIVRENPTAAVNILRTWIGDAA